MEVTGNLAAWLTLSAVILPWVAAIVLRADWSSTVKAVAVAVMSAIDAIVVYGFQNDWEFDMSTLVVAIAGVFALARVTYAGLYNQIGKQEMGRGVSVIKELEISTSPGLDEQKKETLRRAA